MTSILSFLGSRKRPEDTPTVHILKKLRLGGKDLDMNREGVLSDLQKRRLHRGFFWRFSLCALWAIGMFIPFVTMPLTIPADRLVRNPASYVILGAGCALALGFAFVYRRHRRNVEAGHVVAFTGRVKKHPFLKGPPMIVINDREKSARIYGRNGFWQERLFMEGETYTFYAPLFDQDLFVSAEHVPTETPDVKPESDNVFFPA